MIERQNTPNRQSGATIPADDVEAHIANGWSIIEVLNGCNEVFMKPPVNVPEVAA